MLVGRNGNGDVMGVVFFFQAEDGIRDYKVTGVQTCALPIYLHPLRGICSGDAENIGGAVSAQLPGLHRRTENVLIFNRRGSRSEERRVGKECRSRWSPYH